MPRTPRKAVGGVVYHVLNRAGARRPIFQAPEDYEAFERILVAAHEPVPMRTLACCVMPDHGHFVLWPRRGGDLSAFMCWLTLTHTQRWHAAHGTAGSGPLYQGRFKSFPVESDAHLLTVCRYVERNALRAGLVDRAETWQWGSLWRRSAERKGLTPRLLARWPVKRSVSDGRLTVPDDWVRRVNEPLSEADLQLIRRCVARGRPFGGDPWTRRMARKLGLEPTLRPRGRPPRENASAKSDA